MLKALLADMDGTLVHSADANAAAYAAALAEWGIEADPARLAPEIDGRSWRDFLPPLTATRPDVAAEHVARRKRALYPHYFHMLRPNDLLIDLIRSLRGRMRTGLVTTASSVATEAILERFSLADLFDVVVSGDHVQRPKPDPEGYAVAAAMLSVQPEECLIIEDSETGIAAARAFGGGLLRWSEA